MTARAYGPETGHHFKNPNLEGAARVVSALAQHGPLPLAALCTVTGMSYDTCRPVLKRLGRKGEIARIEAPPGTPGRALVCYALPSQTAGATVLDAEPVLAIRRAILHALAGGPLDVLAIKAATGRTIKDVREGCRKALAAGLICAAPEEDRQITGRAPARYALAEKAPSPLPPYVNPIRRAFLEGKPLPYTPTPGDDTPPRVVRTAGVLA